MGLQLVQEDIYSTLITPPLILLIKRLYLTQYPLFELLFLLDDPFALLNTPLISLPPPYLTERSQLPIILADKRCDFLIELFSISSICVDVVIYEFAG